MSPGICAPLTELVTLAPGVLPEDYVDNTPLGRVGTTAGRRPRRAVPVFGQGVLMTGGRSTSTAAPTSSATPDVLGHVERMAQGEFRGPTGDRHRRRIRYRCRAVLALAADGAHVLCTDVDGAAAERTAAALGSNARAARLDVTDAAAVQGAVDDVVGAGRLDLMFNNATASPGPPRPHCSRWSTGTRSSTSTSAAWCTASPRPIRR